MGVVYGTLITIIIFSAGSILTYFLEPAMTKPSFEKGPSVKFNNENISPVQPDSWLYNSAPFIALLGVLTASVVIPVSPDLIGADISIGLFYFIVVVDFVVLAIALGGWGGNNPVSIEACYRIVAQLIAYVVPLGLAVIGPIMMAKSMSTQNIISSQSSHWYILSQPLGFALYVITGLMQVYRAPFLEPFADNIKTGIHSVYGGWKGIMWNISLSGLLFVVAAMGAILFLGGWKGPWLPGPFWLFLKTFALMYLMKRIGQKFKLFSTAKMLELSWKVLIPVGLLNVLIVGGLILLGVGGK